MPKVLIDGNYIDVPESALFGDDGQTPLSLSQQAVTGRTFTEDDIARVRQEEKDKLYTQISRNNDELTALRDQVGSLTAAEQRRAAQLEEERQALEAEARRKEEDDLDAKTLIQRKEQEWQQQLAQTTQTWEQRFEAEAEQRRAAEALAQREREFSDLREYTLGAVQSNEDKIAPQLRQWIGGNSKEEVDASIARAIETTDQITQEMQAAISGQQFVPGQQVAVVPGAQPVPPVMPGTRPTGGPANIDPAGQQSQTLTAEQINNMPMDQYAKLRSQLGIGGQGNNRGLFG